MTNKHIFRLGCCDDEAAELADARETAEHIDDEPTCECEGNGPVQDASWCPVHGGVK